MVPVCSILCCCIRGAFAAAALCFLVVSCLCCEQTFQAQEFVHSPQCYVVRWRFKSGKSKCGVFFHAPFSLFTFNPVFCGQLEVGSLSGARSKHAGFSMTPFLSSPSSAQLEVRTCGEQASATPVFLFLSVSPSAQLEAELCRGASMVILSKTCICPYHQICPGRLALYAFAGVPLLVVVPSLCLVVLLSSCGQLEAEACGKQAWRSLYLED
ncbi:unnamed protein product [Closterium sp. Naga37s-1]|nr:unnamed protein product [Closterium sp. Naga37s-1]